MLAPSRACLCIFAGGPISLGLLALLAWLPFAPKGPPIAVVRARHQAAVAASEPKRQTSDSSETVKPVGAQRLRDRHGRVPLTTAAWVVLALLCLPVFAVVFAITCWLFSPVGGAVISTPMLLLLVFVLWDSNNRRCCAGTVGMPSAMPL